VAREETQLTLLIECSKGTYIRALARDLGTALGCGAHLGALERTFVGDFALEQATSLADLQDHPELLPQILLPPETVILHWPIVVLDVQQTRAVCNGQLLKLAENLEGEWARAHRPDGQLLALLHRQNDFWQPEKVLA
jgi:tRNA pseudouridine55 synthase